MKYRNTLTRLRYQIQLDVKLTMSILYDFAVTTFPTFSVKNVINSLHALENVAMEEKIDQVTHGDDTKVIHCNKVKCISSLHKKL